MWIIPLQQHLGPKLTLLSQYLIHCRKKYSSFQSSKIFRIFLFRPCLIQKVDNTFEKIEYHMLTFSECLLNFPSEYSFNEKHTVIRDLKHITLNLATHKFWTENLQNIQFFLQNKYQPTSLVKKSYSRDQQTIPPTTIMHNSVEYSKILFYLKSYVRFQNY